MKKIRSLNPAVVTQNAQLKALESVLLKTHEFFERKVRRWFARTLNTAYMDTFKIPWEEVLLHYYEAGIENLPYNEVFDIAVQEYLPEFMDATDKEDEEFAQSLVEEQKATLKAKAAKDKQKSALEQATSQLASNASKVVEKVQSISKALDNQRPKPVSKKLKFDDEGDPENF